MYKQLPRDKGVTYARVVDCPAAIYGRPTPALDLDNVLLHPGVHFFQARPLSACGRATGARFWHGTASGAS